MQFAREIKNEILYNKKASARVADERRLRRGCEAGSPLPTPSAFVEQSIGMPTNPSQRLRLPAPVQARLKTFDKGWVWLAGAGPGDPTLVTLQLYDALQQLKDGDCVVYDFLVSDEILSMVPKEVERLYAGKRGGKPSSCQADISETLIVRAQEGKRVLRLKGGDPFLFARGGEEMLELAAASVPFRVLPGLSAAPAGLAYANIPLTHREHNSSVTFLTGHDMTGELPRNIRWKELARSAEVLVFYMALKPIAALTRLLVKEGRAPEEPIALLQNATLPDETIVVGKLKDAAKLARNMSPPVVFVIGSVVELRARLTHH